MRWQLGRRSSNIEDRRNVAYRRRLPGGGMRWPGGGLRVPGGAARGGIGGLVGLAAFVLVALLLGVDPGVLLQDTGSGGAPVATDERAGPPPADDELAQFVAVVLADTEDTWAELFAARQLAYEDPTLVLFRDQVDSACGFASAAVGPFYCPGDQKMYLDLGFFDALDRRLDAPGDFAQAYVIAHEVGHHVQNLLGITDEVRAAQQRADEAAANALSVRLELQADCFAGVWAYHAHDARQILEEGDVEEALTAASAIGDDQLQMQGQGYVVPESFTHGTSEQRMRWFSQGLRQGTLEACNTFAAGEA